MSNTGCVIDQIILRQEKAGIVFEDDTFIAFLDHRPLFHGHTLVAPREHIQNIHELPFILVEPLFSLVKKIALAVETAMESQGSFIAMNNVVSQSIPHLHVHVVPRNRGDGLKGFFWPRTRYESEQQMLETKTRIQGQLV